VLCPLSASVWYIVKLVRNLTKRLRQRPRVGAEGLIMRNLQTALLYPAVPLATNLPDASLHFLRSHMRRLPHPRSQRTRGLS